MAHGARKHALQNYVYVRSLQKYLQLYYDLIGRQSLVSQEMPTPEIDASVPVPAKVGATADSKKPLVTMAELHDPDSLEAKVTESAEALPKWRVEQEQERNKREQNLSQQIANQQSNGDVLQVFEAELAKPQQKNSAFNERARGVADESEELLSMEALATPKAAAPALAAPPAPASAVKPAPASVASPAPAPAPVSTTAPAAAPILTFAPELVPTPAPAAAVVSAPEPASVTQPLAALALLETPPAEQPVQLGLLGNDPPAPAKEESQQQLDLLASG
jgi:hypothetical protein